MPVNARVWGFPAESQVFRNASGYPRVLGFPAEFQVFRISSRIPGVWDFQWPRRWPGTFFHPGNGEKAPWKILGGFLERPDGDKRRWEGFVEQESYPGIYSRQKWGKKTQKWQKMTKKGQKLPYLEQEEPGDGATLEGFGHRVIIPTFFRE